MSSTPAINASNKLIPRKRRLSYTRVACSDECQRRKTKCTGEQPCKVCRNSNNTCLYKRTTRFRSGDRASSNNAMTGAQSAASPSTTSKKASRSSAPQSSGPQSSAPQSSAAQLACSEGSPLTRSDHPAAAVVPASGASNTSAPPTALPGSDYYLHLAEKFLITSEPLKHDSRRPKHSHHVAGTLVLQSLIFQQTQGSPGSALAIIDAEKWHGIIGAYEEEIGLQYPFLDVEQLKHDIQMVSRQDLHDSHTTNRPTSRSDDPPWQRISDIAILVLTIVSFLVDSDIPRVADSWVEKTYAVVLAKTQLTVDIDVDDASALILACIYFFLTDREILAWRGIGIVLRLLVEQDSKKSEASTMQRQDQDFQRADKMFWAVFAMERRFSFGTGLPFAVNDTEIDRHPTFTEDSISSLYLKAMISYCRIGSDVRKWLLESASSAGCSFDSTRDLLDFRIEQWHRNLPNALHFDGVEDAFRPGSENRGSYRIRLTLHLRANQMKIIIHRRSAVRAGMNGLDPSTAKTLAAVSHETIQILFRLAQDTEIYQQQHKTFNHFLEGALSSLLLVLGSLTDEAKTALYMKDAFDSLDLIESLSTASPISARLRERFHTIRHAIHHFRQRNEKPSHLAIGSSRESRADQRPSFPPPPGRTSSGNVSSDIMSSDNFSQGQGMVRRKGGSVPEMSLMVGRMPQMPNMMPIAMGDRPLRQEQAEPGHFAAYSQPEDMCSSLTADPYPSTGALPHTYSSASEAPPAATEAFAVPDPGVCSNGGFYQTYFPELSQAANLYDNSFVV